MAGFVATVYRRRAPARIVVGHQRKERNRDPKRAEQWLGYFAQHLVHLDRDRQDLAWWEIGDSCAVPPASRPSWWWPHCASQ
ncbi:hypothetical protein NKH18_18855 [Streptomyces sp. M10(2022)]